MARSLKTSAALAKKNKKSPYVTLTDVVNDLNVLSTELDTTVKAIASAQGVGNLSGAANSAGVTIPSTGQINARYGYQGVVATHCALMTDFYATNKQMSSRSHHFARDDISSLKLAFANWYVDAGGGYVEKGTGADATLIATVEYPAGTFTPATLNGQPTMTLPDGLTTVTDEVKVSIPRGAAFWVRTYWQSTAGILYLKMGWNNAAGDQAEFAASGIADKTQGGTYTPTQAGRYFGPAAIISNTSCASVFLLGDSRINGQNDTADATGDVGQLARSIGREFGYINVGIPGDRASAVATGYAKRLDLSKYCSHVVSNLGTNDLFQGNSAATIQGNIQTIATAFARAGRSVYWATITPSTTSTDSWATTANQTVKTSEANRVAVNNWLRTGGIPYLLGHFECADPVETARDSGVWKAPGRTTDGTHETQLANLEIRDAIYPRNWVFSL